MSKRDIPYMHSTIQAALEQVGKISHVILWSVVAFIVALLIWANVATLDEITRGQGKVIPSSDMQVIQNLEGGIVKDILVHEGQIVQKGQILMIIDDTRFASSFRENQAKIASLEGRVARLTAEVSQTTLTFTDDFKKTYPQIVQDETELHNTRLKELEVQVNILQEDEKQKSQELLENKRHVQRLQDSLSLVQKELKITRPLVQQGAVSEVELLRLERTVNDTQGDLAATQLAIPRLEAAVKGAQTKIEETQVGFRSKVQTELTQTKSELLPLKEMSLAEEDRVERTLVRSPVRGTVNQLKVNTIGGIVQPGADMVEIVPLEDTLLIEAEINPKDVGFLRPGLPATVKITAYDFSIYGGLKGTVEYISPDTIINEKKENMYQIRIRTAQNYLEKYGKQHQIMPGMRASVDILTGKKTVMEYLLKPILKTKEMAMTER